MRSHKILANRTAPHLVLYNRLQTLRLTKRIQERFALICRKQRPTPRTLLVRQMECPHRSVNGPGEGLLVGSIQCYLHQRETLSLKMVVDLPKDSQRRYSA